MNDFRYELLKNDADEFLIKHNSIYKTKGIKQNVVFILHIGATFTVIYSDFDMHEELCQEVIYIFTQHLLLMNGVFGLGNQYLRADEQEQANRRIPFFKVRLDARITNEKFGTKLYN
ncbi:hypothetical protein HLH17_13875 [Acinetobacter sp. ANC 5380]|uniref:Uncharacterized protein n=1 Tax=Acinetobacter terrae TaxID=2731247 RepID=A0A7Y2RHG1_9GAMM|nr:hypothetical protein [Acinetobacter terrae]NNH78719.1 hypothetical protein [Acinetobacter terrae]